MDTTSEKYVLSQLSTTIKQTEETQQKIKGENQYPDSKKCALYIK